MNFIVNVTLIFKAVNKHCNIFCYIFTLSLQLKATQLDGTLKKGKFYCSNHFYLKRQILQHDFLSETAYKLNCVNLI